MAVSGVLILWGDYRTPRCRRAVGCTSDIYSKLIPSTLSFACDNPDCFDVGQHTCWPRVVELAQVNETFLDILADLVTVGQSDGLID